jgi:hypothetical protein
VGISGVQKSDKIAEKILIRRCIVSSADISSLALAHDFNIPG